MKISQALDECMAIDGAIAASVVDSNNGFMLGAQGKGLDLEYASAGNTELYHAKQKIMKNLGLTNEKIDDFLITLTTQLHILMPAHQLDGVFIYFVLDKGKGTLALARRQLKDIAAKLEL